jgi:hypothetical protein
LGRHAFIGDSSYIGGFMHITHGLKKVGYNLIGREFYALDSAVTY